jgi:hypothetical protein
MASHIVRTVVAAEAGLILLPTTIFCMYALATVLLLTSASGGGGLIPWLVVPTFALAAMACGWILVFRFVRGGWQALANSSTALWILPTIMATTVIVALWAMWSNSAVAASIRPFIGEMAYGAPAVIPFLHIGAERLLRSNTSLERTRER